MTDSASSSPVNTSWETAMQVAIAEGVQAEVAGEVPVGAVLLDSDGAILARAHNQSITLSDPAAHAEILVLRKGAQKRNNYRLTDTTLVVTLEPCLMCLGAMVHARIKRLVFGAFDPKTGVVASRMHGTELEWLNHRIEVVSGVLAEESGRMLRDFFRTRRNTSAV